MGNARKITTGEMQNLDCTWRGAGFEIRRLASHYRHGRIQHAAGEIGAAAPNSACEGGYPAQAMRSKGAGAASACTLDIFPPRFVS
jgi:hypothetical protein